MTVKAHNKIDKHKSKSESTIAFEQWWEIYGGKNMGVTRISAEVIFLAGMIAQGNTTITKLQKEN